jgi:hypothetical protein
VVLKSITDLQKSGDLGKILFVYKPHPREQEERWVNNRVLKKSLGASSKTKAFSLPRSVWENSDLTTRNICIASDLVINLCSTVGIEQLLSTTIKQNTSRFGKSIPLFVTLKPLTGDYYKAANEIKSFAPVAETPDEVLTLIRELINNPSIVDKYKTPLEQMRSQYRFKAPAALPHTSILPMDLNRNSFTNRFYLRQLKQLTLSYRTRHQKSYK